MTRRQSRFSTRCHEQDHAPVGTMSWPPATEPFDINLAHASISVCARTDCHDEARAWVFAEVGEQGRFSTYVENRAAARAREVAS